MPRYQYRCENGHEFEVNKPMAVSDSEEKCPICDHEAYRVFAAPQVEVYGGTPVHHRRDV